jgi:hypothetical protein
MSLEQDEHPPRPSKRPSKRALKRIRSSRGLPRRGSGSATPSEEDVVFTRAVRGGAEAIATPLLDHVVVARQHVTSTLDAGLLASTGR